MTSAERAAAMKKRFEEHANQIRNTVKLTFNLSTTISQSEGEVFDREKKSSGFQSRNQFLRFIVRSYLENIGSEPIGTEPIQPLSRQV